MRVKLVINYIFKKIKIFHHRENGGILIFVGLCLLPMFLVLGLAVDGSFGLTEKRKLQAAADAAAKAGAIYGGSTLATITAEAQKVFAVNTVNMTNISGPNITYNQNTQVITVSASILVPTSFMTLGGIPSVTYNAAASAVRYGSGSEVSIVLDLSTTTGNWTSKMISSLQTFINGLPSTTLVSITPIASQISLDPTTTNQNSLLNHLSSTTNDELANPALYPLSSNYLLNTTNYANIYNPLYGNAFPTMTSYYPLPGTCTGWGGPGTYQACSSLYPALCSAGHTSCSANYSYTQIGIPSILPLTLNRTLIKNYLNNLANFSIVDTSVFTSLIIWGWRAIDPQWKDFWLINSDALSTVRASAGIYPQVYNPLSPKNLLLVVTGPPKLQSSSFAENYNYSCNQGKTKWSMTYCGIFPLTSDKSGYLDITCDNYNYKTMDQSLGLNNSITNYYDSTDTSTTYGSIMLNEISAKFLRTCSNIKAKGINIYVITQNDNAILKSCASSAVAPFYQVSGNGVANIDISATNAATTVNNAIAYTVQP